jgi:glucose/sorbosone dehydrogenase
LLGKILRIEPRPGQVPAHAIPPGNPFVGGPGRDEIWSYGLRNPWRFSFDAARGDMVIGDVGQGSREEVDFEPSPGPGVVGGAGANYGWNCDEGLIPYSGAPAECSGLTGFADPVFDYVHQNPQDGAAFGCSIIGGYVVRDPGLGELIGRYLYADYCVGIVRSLALPVSGGGPASGDRGEGLMVNKPTSFGEDSCGRLYLATDSGPVYRLVGTAATECRPGAPATGPSKLAAPVPRRVRLLVRTRDAGRRIKIIVRATPCEDLAGARVQLNRGGERLAVHRLNRRCVARFSVRLTEARTFRALLQASLQIRSRRLRLAPPSAARS